MTSFMHLYSSTPNKTREFKLSIKKIIITWKKPPRKLLNVIGTVGVSSTCKGELWREGFDSNWILETWGYEISNEFKQHRGYCRLRHCAILRLTWYSIDWMLKAYPDKEPESPKGSFLFSLYSSLAKLKRNCFDTKLQVPWCKPFPNFRWARFTFKTSLIPR